MKEKTILICDECGTEYEYRDRTTTEKVTKERPSLKPWKETYEREEFVRRLKTCDTCGHDVYKVEMHVEA